MAMKVKLMHPLFMLLFFSVRDPTKLYESVDSPSDGLKLPFFSFTEELLL